MRRFFLCCSPAALLRWSRLSLQPSLYHNQLIVKIFSFRFLNSFLALYYYAFADLGILRLTTSVASFLIIGSAFRFFIYSVCPAVHRRVIDRVMQRKAAAAIASQQRSMANAVAAGGVGGRPPHSRQRPLSLSCGWQESAHLSYDTFEDYCNLVIQFGYVSFFTVAFPPGAAVRSAHQHRGDTRRRLQAAAPIQAPAGRA